MNTAASQDYRSAGPGGFWRPRVVANLVFYQAAWLACVLGAAAGKPVWGVLAALAAILWHLSQARRPLDELWLVSLTGLLGGAWDSLLVVLGLVHYPHGAPLPWMAPVWIVMLWMAFATTFNVCLGWLHGRWWLASAFGLAGGPLAWWAGHRLGALELVSVLPALAVLALGWAVLMPVLMGLAKRFDGISSEFKPPNYHGVA